MPRPTRAEVDLAALRANYALARQLHGGRALAVVKADAYGHGALRCAQALEPTADGFAVAFLAEALALRAGGIRAPILVLEGVFDADELAQAAAHAIWIAVHHEPQLRMLEAYRGTQRLHAWLLVDSGMHRAGFLPEDVRAAHARLQALPCVADITLMTHFARADEPGVDFTAQQIATFDRAVEGLPGARSLCNSAGTLAWAEAARGDWARPGLLLYGIDPRPEADPRLQPVMTLQSAVFAVRTLQPGDAVGYGGIFVADKSTRVGLVAIGYADGYPRTAPNGTPVAVDGQRTRLIGRVSMDMLTIDLTDLPQAGIGSAVELWGRQIPVSAIADAVGTIAYEVLCHVKRVPLDYVNP